MIGLPEAQAIERRLKGIQIKRPQTHDLLTSVIESLGGKRVCATKGSSSLVNVATGF